MTCPGCGKTAPTDPSYAGRLCPTCEAESWDEQLHDLMSEFVQKSQQAIVRAVEDASMLGDGCD